MKVGVITDEIMPHSHPGITIVVVTKKDTGAVGVEAMTEGEGGDMEMEEDIKVVDHPATPDGTIIMVEGGGVLEDLEEEEPMSTTRVFMVAFSVIPAGRRCSFNKMDTTHKASILTNMMTSPLKLLGKTFLIL